MFIYQSKLIYDTKRVYKIYDYIIAKAKCLHWVIHEIVISVYLHV